MPIRARIGWVWMNKHLNVPMHTGHMESPNLVALCVTELDNTLPPYGCYTGYYRATHDVSAKAYAWKTAQGCGRIWPDSLIVSWMVATRRALLACVCRVVKFIPLQGWVLIRISMTPLDMGDGLFSAPKCSNSSFTMLYLVQGMDIDYLIVDEMINIKILLSQFHA
jgi:hypothetical protein